MVTSCAAGQCTARCLASCAPACISLGVASAPKRQWKAACSVPGKRPAAATGRPSVCATLTRTPVLVACTASVHSQGVQSVPCARTFGGWHGGGAHLLQMQACAGMGGAKCSGHVTCAAPARLVPQVAHAY